MGNPQALKPLLIFDFDGTIADSISNAFESYQLIAREFGLKDLSHSQFLALKELSTGKIIKQLGIPWWKMPGLIRRGRELLADQIDTMDPYPGVVETLEKLADLSCSVAVLTSNSQSNVERFFVRHKLPGPEFIDSVSRLGKKAPYLKKRKRQYREYQLFYVGDEVRDVEAANKAGVHSIAVGWGFNSRQSLLAACPWQLIDTPLELLETI